MGDSNRRAPKSSSRAGPIPSRCRWSLARTRSSSPSHRGISLTA